jgi:hypothetical protein
LFEKIGGEIIVEKKKFIENLNSQVLKVGSRLGSKKNMLKIHKQNTFAHELCKFLICWELLQEGKSFYTEGEFVKGGRGDIIDVTEKRIIEVLNSETKRDFLEKTKKYPGKFEIEAVEIDEYAIGSGDGFLVHG